MLQVQQKEMGVAAAAAIKKDWKTIAKEKMNYDVDQCPCCKKGRMMAILHFDANAPPPFWGIKKNSGTKKRNSTMNFFSVKISKGDGIACLEKNEYN